MASHESAQILPDDAGQQLHRPMLALPYGFGTRSTAAAEAGKRVQRNEAGVFEHCTDGGIFRSLQGTRFRAIKKVVGFLNIHASTRRYVYLFDCL